MTAKEGTLLIVEHRSYYAFHSASWNMLHSVSPMMHWRNDVSCSYCQTQKVVVTLAREQPDFIHNFANVDVHLTFPVCLFLTRIKQVRLVPVCRVVMD